MLVGYGVDLCGTWSQSSKYLVPGFQHCLLPALEMHSLFLFVTSFPSQCALILMALYIDGSQEEFEVYGLMDMCNLALRE